MTNSDPKPVTKRFVVPLHPILFALFPLLALYTRNLDQVPLSDLLQPLAMAVVAALVVWTVFWIAFRHVRKAAAATTAVLIAYSSFPHLIFLSPTPIRWLVGPVELIAVTAVAAALFKTRQPLRDMTSALNVAAGFLVLSSCWVIGSSFWRASRPGAHRNERTPMISPQGSTAGGPKQISKRVHGNATAKTAHMPDVYYLILDAYGRADSLKMFFGYDNTPFVHALESRGFYVAHHSRANYDETPLCLASALNFTYLDDLAERTGPSGSLEECRKMLDDNAVATYLSKIGYRYVYIGSGVNQAKVLTADMTLNDSPDLPHLLDEVSGIDAVNPHSAVHHPRIDQHRNRLIGAFDSLEAASRLPFQKFVFTHVLAPHPPFVLGPNGEPVYPNGPLSFADGSWLVGQISREQYVKGYLSQLEYVNKRTLHAIDTILSQSRQRPIIIVQGDHGSRMNLDWESLEQTDTREAFSNLNAYCVPSKARAHLYDTISPVNSFRIVLNDVFGAAYKLLPDRSYYSTVSEPYAFTDVTPLSALPSDSPSGTPLGHAGRSSKQSGAP